MKNILVIEDDPITITLYKYILKKAGYNYYILEDGNEIINLLEDVKIHLIIMDISLRNSYLNGQKMDGIKLSSYIKGNSRYENIPIIIVTAYSAKIEGDDFFKRSFADDVLTKPIVDFNLFISKINTQIKN
ncbi:MAG TPA: response regulator [Ignavibacteriaceae bacterium]|jgi:CheY-like chemotaxis protein|nr:response regulator [Ignavibacteriaceae bacterium]